MDPLYQYLIESIDTDPEVQVGRYLYHKSPPLYRDMIREDGLRASVGEQRYGYYSDDVPRVFATDSENPEEWFDSTYDDDIWRIDTSTIPGVVWHLDKNFNAQHVYTISDIPASSIRLEHKGSGNSIF